MNVLELIHKVSPYKDFNYLDYEGDMHGWHSDDSIFRSIIEACKPKLIIEIGTWKGASAITMVNVLKDLGLTETKIICVDTWLGDEDFWNILDDKMRYKSLKLKNGYPTVYYTFLSNVVKNKAEDYIIPLPSTSHSASIILRRKCVMADLVYLDAAHNYIDVMQDLKDWYPVVNKGGYFFGDDYKVCQGVAPAVDEFMRDNGQKVNIKGSFWYTQK